MDEFYAYLVLARNTYDVRVVMFDGAMVGRFADTNDDRLAAQELFGRLEALKHEEAKRRRDADIAAWSAEIKMEPFQRRVDRGGLRKTPVDYVRLRLPSSAPVEVLPQEVDRTIREAQTKRFPTSPRESFYDVWQKARVEKVRTWILELIDNHGTHRLDLDLDGWPHGMPMAAIIPHLNRMSADGWRLISVTEDHGLYAGVDANHESFPTRIRYLLTHVGPV